MLAERTDEGMVIEGSSLLNVKKVSEMKQSSKKDEQEKYGTVLTEECFIAVDIGTTTIAMALIEEKTGIIRDMYFSGNHQRKFGADVISRIKAANEQNAEELKRLIETDLRQGINKLTENKKVVFHNHLSKMEKKKESAKIRVSKIVIAGNTTMIHLLMGYSCESLGKYPFGLTG